MLYRLRLHLLAANRLEKRALCAETRTFCNRRRSA